MNPKALNLGVVILPRRRRGRSGVFTSRWVRVRRDLAVVAVAAVAAGVSSAAGVASIPWLWLLLVGAALAALGVCVTEAIQAGQPAVRITWWQRSLVVALLLPLGAFAYHLWFDPAAHTPRTYQFVVNGGNAQFIYLYGEAGGEPQKIETGFAAQNGLIGGQTQEFECWVIGRDGAEWLRYRRFGRVWWAPRAKLHPPAGIQQPSVPHC